MISKLLYRDTVKSILDYITSKAESKILGYKNMYSKEKTNLKFFENTINFLANRREASDKFLHLSLNLPPEDKINDDKFFTLAKDFMDEFGYSDQPFIVVKHNDTNHPHVHIVTTRVKEDLSLVSNQNDYKRGIATCRYIEKKYNLTNVPSVKEIDRLKAFRENNINETINSESEVKNYIKEVTNILLNKYKFKSVEEFKKELKQTGIKLVLTNNKKGFLFGLENNDKFKTPVIFGSKIHPSFSYPKLNSLFEKNKANKIVASSRRRIEKQVLALLDTFDYININEFKELNLLFNKIDLKLDINANKRILGYSIYDKTNYIFKSSEVSKKITLNSLKNRVGEERNTQLNTNSKGFKNLLSNVIREAFRNRYFKYIRQDILYSELIERTNLKDIVDEIINNEKLNYVLKFQKKEDRNEINSLMKYLFLTEKSKLIKDQNKLEIENLKNTGELYENINKTYNFNNEVSRYHLIQSLGLKTDGNNITYIDSNKHQLKIEKITDALPKKLYNFKSYGFINQNNLMLDYLFLNNKSNLNYIKSSAFFLPMIYDNIYKNLSKEKKNLYEYTVLEKYYKDSLEYQTKYEKNEKDFVNHLNFKGFYIEKENQKYYVKSVVLKDSTKYPLSDNITEYLESNNDLIDILNNQNEILNLLKDEKEPLKNLWLTNLLEKGIYDKAAYLILNEKTKPIIPEDILQEHLENGLQQELEKLKAMNISREKDLARKRTLYSMKSLLNNKDKKNYEAYNGFKDELTDYSKYKSISI